MYNRPMASPVRVLIVEDEPMVAEVVERYLRREGMEGAIAADGEKGLELARNWNPDVIVLDLMLPKIDGLEICRTLRKESNVPIIMLTARGEETDRIVGLEIGADDYVVKPFSPKELVTRIKVVLRRASLSGPGIAPGAAIKAQDLAVNPGTRTVQVRDKPVELTAKEFDLLLFLLTHRGQVFTREQLMDQVWDFAYAGDTSTVTVHIRRLREKIEADPAKPRWLKTVWGVGYKLEA
ncbi:MAG: two component transcriptional regulator, winged helix family [Dehalococcoidia bacterium]|nr:two component transcriptional regulator, winged helix family [Dehalococcoidia bacterium]